MTSSVSRLRSLKKRLNRVYGKYSRREYAQYDPLKFLYGYGDIRDREIAGLVASSLAYGRVAQIVGSVSAVLDRLGPSPRLYVEETKTSKVERAFTGFRHRWTTGADIAALLAGVKLSLEEHGSLNALFLSALSAEDKNTAPALENFAELIGRFGRCASSGFVPRPSRGSACKRMNLYLRWMVRKDRVDPGGWTGVGTERLIVPLDTHLHRVGLHLGFTRRKQADFKAAIEITEAFRKIAPDDPVKYDFALTRPGIRMGAAPGDFILETERGKQPLKAAS